jgi:molybdopterin-guanine dinucleotide biosynthesis protein MobB
MTTTALQNAKVPVLGLVAFSGTGKTTLLTQLLPLLIENGLRVAVVKHAHHGFDIDHPGKDSYLARKAGAVQTLVASHERWALMTETPGQAEPHLDALLRHLDQDGVDMILVEGFKHETFPKIELHRSALDHALLYPHDSSIIALACDAPIAPPAPVARLDLNDVGAIARFIIAFVSERRRNK